MYLLIFLSIILHYYLPGTGFIIFKWYRLGVISFLFYQLLVRLPIQPIWGNIFQGLLMLLSLLLGILIRNKTRIMKYLAQEGMLPSLSKETVHWGLTREEEESYHYFRELIGEGNYIAISPGYLYILSLELLDEMEEENREETLQTFKTLYEKYLDQVDFTPDFNEIIGLCYLALGDKREAIQWFQKLPDRVYQNFIISYYHFEVGLESMPWQYWIMLSEGDGLPPKEGEEFKEFLLYINALLEKETQKSLLDLLNRRKIHYNEKSEPFSPSIYLKQLRKNRQITIPFHPYKEYLHHEKTQKTLQNLQSFFFSPESQPLEDRNIPWKIRYYLKQYQKELSGKAGVKREKPLPEPRRKGKKQKRRVIQLDQKRIRKALKEQEETAVQLEGLLSQPEEEKERKKGEGRKPIQSLEELFQLKPQKSPNLDPTETELLKKLLQNSSLTQLEIKDILKEGFFIKETMDTINYKFYEILGDTLVEEIEGVWVIKEEYRKQLEGMVLE